MRPPVPPSTGATGTGQLARTLAHSHTQRLQIARERTQPPQLPMTIAVERIKRQLCRTIPAVGRTRLP